MNHQRSEGSLNPTISNPELISYGSASSFNKMFDDVRT